MRLTAALMFLSFLVAPRIVDAQSLELYGSAGPTITDAGNSVSAGAGFSPASRLTLVFSFERTYLSTRISRDGLSRFRGGTLLLGTAELRVTPFGRGRFGPFGLVGLAAGQSRPNVNGFFSGSVTNEIRAMFVGGGLQVPLGAQAAVFGDARMIVGSEGHEGMVAVAPVRIGMTWRF